MFTGLVKEIGKVKRVTRNTEGTLIEVYSEILLPEIGVDDSVSINGACQTAIEVKEKTFIVQAVQVTMEKSTLGQLKAGEEVNLELAMRLQDRLGGHMVQGHVNDVGTIRDIRNTGKNYLVIIGVSSSQMKYIVKEGSVTIDGVSLTVSEIFKADCSFQVSVIPHTWDHTIFKNKRTGSSVNIEVDILGKYIENLLFADGGHIKDLISKLRG
ncbi:MAG: riboflavin synthase [Bdellovibrionota bacterium]|nr:riboflavin synthase [Bdellovibrionota bacterium]